MEDQYPESSSANLPIQETGASQPSRPVKLLCSQLVELRWQQYPGQSEHRPSWVSCMANLEEIWTDGATLDAEEWVPEEQELLLVREPVQMRARRLYCRNNGTGFTVGIQFAHGCAWSTEVFLPDHAVNPQDFAPSKIREKIHEEPNCPQTDGVGAASAFIEQGSLHCLGVIVGAR